MALAAEKWRTRKVSRCASHIIGAVWATSTNICAMICSLQEKVDTEVTRAAADNSATLYRQEQFTTARISP